MANNPYVSGGVITAAGAFAARRTRAGTVVAYGLVNELVAAMDAREVVDVVPPEGWPTTPARIVAVGRSWQPDDDPDAAPVAYGYLRPLAEDVP